ncbi:hypothetical protein DRQ25_10585 [Candidatus Fermentibacteria bacterium]|nr:MAG: hypothetical protein DRQ25_10585 [Candidatus Fermentibacteria bacterium]
MEIGDRVYKKSRKPFQHGKRVGVIVNFDNLIIKEKEIDKPAAVIEGCNGPVVLEILRTDVKGLSLMAMRDDTEDIADILKYNQPI